MAMNRYDPATRYLTFRDAVDRMIDQMWGRSGPTRMGSSVLPIDMYERQDELVILAGMPGAKPDDVEISVTGDSLTIRATITSEAESDEATRWNWYLHELDHGQYTRTISLPFPVSSDRADAQFENGILRLTLPKSEEAKPRRIQVQGRGGQPKQIDVEQQ
jgi:HSP20 family protein